MRFLLTSHDLSITGSGINRPVITVQMWNKKFGKFYIMVRVKSEAPMKTNVYFYLGHVIIMVILVFILKYVQFKLKHWFSKRWH